MWTDVCKLNLHKEFIFLFPKLHAALIESIVKALDKWILGNQTKLKLYIRFYWHRFNVLCFSKWFITKILIDMHYDGSSSWRCFNMCRFKCTFWGKLVWHSSQAYGLLFICILSWTFKDCCLIKLFSQKWHLYGFSPICVLWWNITHCFLAKLFSQKSHL